MPGRSGEQRSAVREDACTVARLGESCGADSAVQTVSRVARHALRFTSVPSVRMSLRPKIDCACAATKASTTPDPVPASTTRGVEVEGFCNLVESHADSDGEESVSRKRYESSEGS